MKKLTLKSIFYITTFLSLLTFSVLACSNGTTNSKKSEDKTVYLKVASVYDTKDEASLLRTALPTFDTSEITKLKLYGKKNNSNLFTLLTESNSVEELINQIIPIEPGEWQLKLEALIGNVQFIDIQNYNFTAFSSLKDNYGTETIHKIYFNLKVSNYGTKENTGSLSVRLNLPEENDVIKIKAGLFTLYEDGQFYPLGHSEVQDFEKETLIIKEKEIIDEVSGLNKNQKYVVYEKTDIPVDKYLLKFYFYGDEDEKLQLNLPYNEIVIIADSHLSSSEHTISALNSVYHLDYNFNMGQLNDSEPITLETSYCYNTEITLVTPPYIFRNGYDFGGWYTTETFEEGTNITEIPFETNKDVTVYAKWNPITYTINYNYGIGGIAPQVINPVTYTPEDTFLLNEPTNQNETLFFSGWYENPDFTGISYTQIERYSYGNKTFYAKWSSGDFKINYILNGGTNSKNNPESYQWEDDDIVLSEPQRAGCIFKGWYTTSIFEDDSKYEKIESHTTGDITLFAKWDANAYKIEYELNGKHATNVEQNPVGYTVESEDIVLQNPVNDGYKFIGWYTEKTFENEIKTIPQGSVGDIKLYAKWELITYSIQYNLNGGELSEELNPENYNVECEKIELNEPSKFGYEFTGWLIKSWDEYKFDIQDLIFAIPAESFGEIVLEAQFEPIINGIFYIITEDVDNSKNINTYTIELQEDYIFAEPERPNYIFDGWYYESDFTNKADRIKKGSFGPVEVYAKWTPIVYTIQYEGLEPGENNNPETYTVETEDIILTNQQKTGYNFTAWYFVKDGTVLPEPVSEIKKGSYGNIVLKQVFTPITYTINYHLYQGNNNSNNPATYNIETPTITLENPEKEDYTFDGWYLNENFTGSKIEEIELGTYGNIELYAKFNVNPYESAIKLEKFTYDEALPYIEEPEISENAIIFNGPKDFETYIWSIDNVELPNNNDDSFIIWLYETPILGGYHTVELLVTDSNNNLYSVNYEFLFRK
ncbi:MAG: InlB B-repeat-containing protein [Treponema sp.]|nr:InlB B-repeat-containing protein [Treponema sp.]